MELAEDVNKSLYQYKMRSGRMYCAHFSLSQHINRYVIAV